MAFRQGTCIRVHEPCCCCCCRCRRRSIAAPTATASDFLDPFTPWSPPMMSAPPTLSIQIYACAHVKEVLTFESSWRISQSRQLLFKIHTYIHENQTCIIERQYSLFELESSPQRNIALSIPAACHAPHVSRFPSYLWCTYIRRNEWYSQMEALIMKYSVYV